MTYRLYLGVFVGTMTTSPALAQARASLAITHVTVIDVVTGNRLPDRTVITRGNRIEAIVAGSAEVPRGARVINGTGRFLIPGLWDMHVHAAWAGVADWSRPLYVANGVTGVRDTWGSRAITRLWRDSLERAAVIGPRLVAAGNLVDGTPPVSANSIIATSALQGRRVVDSLKADGADFIKVYSRLSREAYFAIADEARRRRIPFAGHVPWLVTAVEASNAGQKSFEHLFGIASGCSIRGVELDARLDSLQRARPDTTLRGLPGTRLRRAIRESYDKARCDSLLRLLAANKTWQVPTLVLLRAQAYQNDSSIMNDARLRYLPTSVVRSWDWRLTQSVRIRSDEGWVELRRGYERSLQFVGDMSRAGVPILAGTDPLNPYCLPGFSLHDELQLLVRAGLTPLQALRAATLSPAEFFNATDSLGTVEAGKVADLILLGADPLMDISNTTRISGVVADGRFYDRAMLDAVLANAARPEVSVPLLELADKGASAVVATLRRIKSKPARQPLLRLGVRP